MTHGSLDFELLSIHFFLHAVINSPSGIIDRSITCLITEGPVIHTCAQGWRGVYPVHPPPTPGKFWSVCSKKMFLFYPTPPIWAVGHCTCMPVTIGLLV